MKQEIEINMQHHDLVLLARKNYPTILVDGVPLNGVEKIEFTHSDFWENCCVKLTFNENIKSNPIPFDDINLLKRLYTSPDRITVQDALKEKYQPLF